MNMLMTGLRAYWAMLPFYLVFAALLALAEYFFPNNTGVVGAIFAYLATLYLTHSVILSGDAKSLWRSSTSGHAGNPLSLRFIGVVILVVGAPLAIGVTVGIALLQYPGSNVVGLPTLIGLLVVVLLWISLSIWGVAIPRLVWKDGKHTAEIDETYTKRVWPFAMFWLAVWNVTAFAILYGFYALFYSGLPTPAGAWVILDSTFRETVEYIYVALTAAVLSHAFLRAYDLGPQGLITKP